MIDDPDLERVAERVESSLAEVRDELRGIRDELARLTALQEALLREVERTNELLRRL